MSHVHGGGWRDRDGHQACSYCGSMTVAEAIRRMTTVGCSFSGTDKGAYKFYFHIEGGKQNATDGSFGKFYGAHLADCTEDELAKFSEASRRCLGWDFEFVGNGQPPKAWAPKSNSFYGWQTWGKVGPDGKAMFEDGAPIPPDEAWWAKQRSGK